MDKCTCDFICGFSRVFVLLMFCGGIVFGGLGFIFYLAQLLDTGPRRRKGPDTIYKIKELRYTYICKGWKNRVGNAIKTAGCAILSIMCIYFLYRIFSILLGAC